MELRFGDLFAQDDVDAVGHGVNCMGVMGAGIAKTFKNKYPIMFNYYKNYCENNSLKPGMVFPWLVKDDSNIKYVYNLVSQNRLGPDAKLEWLEQSLVKMIKHAESHGVKKIGLPLVGGGIGGLPPEKVEKLLYDINSKTFKVNIVLIKFS